MDRFAIWSLTMPMWAACAPPDGSVPTPDVSALTRALGITDVNVHGPRWGLATRVKAAWLTVEHCHSLTAAADESDEALVAGFISAFNQRDLDGMLTAVHPAVEFHPLRVIGIDKRYDGRAGVEKWFAQLVAQEHEHRIVVSRFEATPTGALVAAGRLELPDRGTPAPFCGIYRLDNSLIASGRHYISERVTLTRLGVPA